MLRHVKAIGRWVIFGLFAINVPAYSQVDLAGEWRNSSDEERASRGEGPELGDYMGLPINAAARQVAQTWDASILSQPAMATRPHPAQYSLYGPAPNFRLSEIVHPSTGAPIGYKLEGMYGGADRTIWLDGRPHPSPYAEHMYSGFSTGEWRGSTLRVSTTHMKFAFMARNGVPSSPDARMTLYFKRHGEHLVLFSWLDDPVYLEEPLVRTATFTLSPLQLYTPQVPFEAVDELNRGEGWVPHWPLGTEHRDFAAAKRLPYEATLGGRHTLYPEYQDVLAKMPIEPMTREGEREHANQ